MGARADGGHEPTVKLEGNDVRTLLRLWGRLHAPAAEPAERKRRLIAGLCGLFGAHAGASVVIVLDPESGHPEVVSVVNAAADGKRPPAVAPWHDSRENPALAAAPRGGYPLQSSLHLGRKPIVVASMTLLRGARAGPPAAHAVGVLNLVHEEARSLYAADALLASPPVRRLPRRQRHVLQYLLAGESEAHVAGHLGVDVRAVRSECKAAYKSLGVADHEALLARWAAS